VHSGLSTHLNTAKQHFKAGIFVMLILLWCSHLTAGYDFDKLAALAKQKYGEEAFKDITQLQQLIAQLKTAPDSEKLKKVNDFFNNKIMFADDLAVWGKTDYWATPLESIGRQAGDCEDFSIAKYMFLRAADIPNNKLRLTYVKATMNSGGLKNVRAHMVLSYYATPQSEPLILDNLNTEIYPASSRTDLSPVFSFNDKGLWVGSSSKPKSDSQSHLSTWRDVLLRMQLDGLE
jgi:predicted transglutaminase-like cysteine proteinase